MSQLADRYGEVMRFRLEALQKYHADVLSLLAGPPSTILLPTVSLRDGGSTIKRIGPFHFSNRPPVAPFVDRAIASAEKPVRILEIGPGDGALSRELHARHRSKIASYYAFDRDHSVRGEFTFVSSLADVSGEIDLVIAAEVIEHMDVDRFFEDILERLQSKLAPNAQFIISTPNPLAPGGVARDFTHVQRYPWYDLYAVFRLGFDDVSVFRTHYVFSFRRLLQIVPRFVLCLLMEFEWCEVLICVGGKPRRGGGATGSA